jgi:hypothetical protein
MELRSSTSGPSDRRWAGAFRVCPSCGGRNWVGQRRCRRCAALLVGVRAVSRPPAAMIGRRSADKVLTPRVRALVIGALVLAVIGGGVVWRLFRAEIDERPFSAASAAPSPAAEPVAEAVPYEEPPSTLDSTRALRAAERGARLLEQGRVKAAVAVLAEAAQVLPDNAELAHTYGGALWRFDARDRALFQFRKALRLAPDNAVYREDLGRALAALGRTAEAAHVLQAPGLASAALDAARAAEQAGPSPAAPVGGDLGGAGTGTYKGRRSFTDADLQRGRVEAPTPAPMEAPTPAPTEEPGR